MLVPIQSFNSANNYIISNKCLKRTKIVFYRDFHKGWTEWMYALKKKLLLVDKKLTGIKIIFIRAEF